MTEIIVMYAINVLNLKEKPMTTLIIIIIIATLAFIVLMQQAEIARKCKSREKYSCLWEFYHFVGTCKADEKNRSYITDRLQSERSLQTDEKALHLVKACEEVFDARFKNVKP